MNDETFQLSQEIVDAIRYEIREAVRNSPLIVRLTGKQCSREAA